MGEPWKCACRRACQAGEVPSFLPHLMSTRIRYQRTGSAVLMRPVCIGGKLTRQERPFCHAAAWEASRRAHFPGSTPHATQEPAASWEGAFHFHEQEAPVATEDGEKVDRTTSLDALECACEGPNQAAPFPATSSDSSILSLSSVQSSCLEICQVPISWRTVPSRHQRSKLLFLLFLSPWS